MKLVKLINKEGRGNLGQIYMVTEDDPQHSQIKVCDTEGRYCFFTSRTNVQPVLKTDDHIEYTYHIKPENSASTRDLSELVPKQALRYNQGKMDWSLVDFKSLEPMVEVLMFGAEKYSPDNWKNGLPIREIFGSLLRHLIAFKDGEDNDPESGKSHIGHAMCNLMFISYMLQNDPEKWDNR